MRLLPLSAISLLFATAFIANSALAQVSPAERLFAERVALLSLDARCNLFNPQQRRALNAFMMQSRGALLRGGTPIERLGLIASQARGGVSGKVCNEPSVIAEAERVKRAHSAWRLQMTASFPGPKRVWQASRAGVDNWRAWQELGNGARAGFVLAPNGLAFGLETQTIGIASARIFLRNSEKIGLPSANMGLRPAIRSGTNTYSPSYIVPAQTKAKVDAAPRNGSLVLFPDNVTRAIINLDPRDCFEVELIRRDGTIEHYIIEVGDVIAAFALGAEI